MSVESVSTWQSTTKGTKAAVIFGMAVAAAVVVWLNFMS
jgi:hypothetical protein